MDNDRNSDRLDGSDSMSVTKMNGTAPDKVGFEGSVGLMPDLPNSNASFEGGTNGAMQGEDGMKLTMAELKQGYDTLSGAVKSDNYGWPDPDDSGEVDQRKPWNDPARGFLTRPMGGER